MNKTYILLGLLLSYICIAYLNHVLISDEVWAESAQEFLKPEQIQEILEKRSNPVWLITIESIGLVFLLLKILLVTVIILAGFFMQRKVEISRSDIFSAVLISEYVHLLPRIILIVWFTFVDTHFTMKDLSLFPTDFPTGTLLRRLESPYDRVFRPFHLFNLVEIMFCLSICFCLRASPGVKYRQSISVVFLSYFGWLFVLALFRSFLISTRI
jgi:hypothetical protein